MGTLSRARGRVSLQRAPSDCVLGAPSSGAQGYHLLIADILTPSNLQLPQDAPRPWSLLRGPTVSHTWALSLGTPEIGIFYLTAGAMETRTRGTCAALPGTTKPHQPPHLLRANVFSRKTCRGKHAQHVSVGTPQGGCVRPGHKGSRWQALKEPRCSPARLGQL